MLSRTVHTVEVRIIGQQLLAWSFLPFSKMGLMLACFQSLGSTLEFMLRQDVLKLYRDVYRMTRSIADQRQKNEIRSWAASEIRTHRNHQDEVTIRGLIIHGQRMLKDLEKSLKVTT
ncbi:LYR motif-containing protein 2-like isoform X1 [Artemia franciscana]|uniref:LYR motif-containing protein 2-like isoform X1 n=1 Tax=Artemia franciscana TaxID=6661 RepID=UPI0032DBE271